MEERNYERRYVTGMFLNRVDAENAYNELTSRGYSHDDINIIMTDEARKKHFDGEGVKTEMGNKALEGAGTGSAIGTALGAIGGAIAAIGTSLVLPGLGLVVAGPLAAALAGAGAGAATGGLVGALIGAGIPEARIEKYEDGIKRGNIVLGVNTKNEDDVKYFSRTWPEQYHAEEVHY
jgi:hypothetical protein